MNQSNSNLGKSLSIASNSPSNQAGGPSTSSIESRRPASTGPSSSSSSAPRKGQASRKQHKNQRRPGGGERTYSSPDAYDAMAEQRLLRNANGRRGQMNITHLLDYQRFQPSHGHGYGYHDRGSRDWRREQGSYMSHARDRDRYVHANYRFIVSPSGTYTGQASDPDMKLSWDLIMQIIASSESQSSSCPICLSEPVAPRMVKCGHVFCLSCFLRFMASTHPSEKDGKAHRGPRCQACPICENEIYHRDAKPTRFYAGQESALPKPGDDVVLRLMARNANSILALPSEGGAEVLNSGDGIPWHFAANVLDYARIMKATPDYMREQFDEEIAALEKQEKEDELMFGEDHEWTQKAIRNINNAKEKLAELGDVDTSPLPSKDGNRRPRASEADFHFYSSQPHLYLSPLDIRILKTKYGSFSQFPSTLLPRVENITTGHHVDDAMRKRAKYLGHLPRGCIVNFLECDWTDIIPEEILDTLKVDIERRRRRNAERLSQEEKYRQHAERQEAAELRRTTGQRLPAIDLDDDRPPMDPSEFQPLSAPSGTSPPESRMGFGTLAELSASPNAQRTVWGTAAPIYEGQEEHHEETWEDDPFNSQNIAAQLEALRLRESIEASQEASGPDASNSGTSGKKKKGKKQKLTLMSTGGRRGM